LRAGAEPWPTAAQAARAGLAARARPRRREIARRASDVGQAQARRSAAPPGPGDLGGRSRTHPQEAHRQRPRRAGSFLRRKPGGRRFPFHANERYAKRLPKGLRPRQPGEIVQIDTLFVNIAPDKAIKRFTVYDPVAKWTIGRVARRAKAVAAKAPLDKLIAEAPFPVKDVQVEGGAGGASRGARATLSVWIGAGVQTPIGVATDRVPGSGVATAAWAPRSPALTGLVRRPRRPARRWDHRSRGRWFPDAMGRAPRSMARRRFSIMEKPHASTCERRLPG